MSMYLIFDGGEPEDFCSNKGYGDFCRWAESLGKGYPSIRGLRKTGGCDDVHGLTIELELASHRYPPMDTPTTSTLLNLIESLKGSSDSKSVIVSNGIVSEGD